MKEVLYNLIENMVDEDSAIITVITGEGVTEEEIENIQNALSEKYSDLDIDVKVGGQPVYSFFVGVE